MKKKGMTIQKAAASFAVIITAMIVSVVIYDVKPHFALLFGCFFAGVMAWTSGYRWEDILGGMVESVSSSVESIIILLLIGVLIGSWIEAGIVPSLLYYGLKLLSPKFYLVSCMLICTLLSLVLGSWGTIGTIGIALIGVASAMGIPLYLAAGAIVSGSYVGDQLSPLSDATNLCSAATGVNVFDGVKKVLPVFAVSIGISAVIFTVIGFRYGSPSSAMEEVNRFTDLLSRNFVISPFLFVPLLVMVACIAFRKPAIPSFALGIVLANLEALTVQKVGLGSILNTAFAGFVSSSGNQVLDSLLSAGGISSMLYSASTIILAMMFGGIMTRSGQIEIIMSSLLGGIKKGGIVIANVLTSCGFNVIFPDQSIAIAVGGKMYAAEYDKRGISRKELFVAVESGGAGTSALVPWNTCGVYITGILGVSTLGYLPFAFYNYLMPIVAILFAYKRIRSSRGGSAPTVQEGGDPCGNSETV